MLLVFFFKLNIIYLDLQITAETAYDMLSPGPPVRRPRGNRKGKRKRVHPPPQDIREGVIRAVEVVREVYFYQIYGFP